MWLLLRIIWTIVFQTQCLCRKKRCRKRFYLVVLKWGSKIKVHWFLLPVEDCTLRRLVRSHQCRVHTEVNEHNRLVWNKIVLRSGPRSCHQGLLPRRPCRRSLFSGSRDSLPLESQSILVTNRNDKCSLLEPWQHLCLVYDKQRTVHLGYLVVQTCDQLTQSGIRHHRHNFCCLLQH